MKIFLPFRLLPLLVLLCGAASAVHPYTPKMADPFLESWRWRHEEALEGLGIVCMDEAPDGTLWFGAPGKIVRYDGIHVDIIEFDEELLSTIEHVRAVPWAKAMLALPDGRLLVLIGESLALYSGDGWKIIIQDTGTSIFRSELEMDSSGICWLSVPGKLWRISADLSETGIVRNAENGSLIGSICIDRSDRLWVVEKDKKKQVQLLCYADSDRTGPANVYPLPQKTEALELRIEAGPEGGIWYADDDKDTPLLIFDPDSETWNKADGSPEARFFSLSRGNDGTIWAGGEQMLVRVSPKTSAIQYTASQLPQPQVPLSAFETRRGQLWVLGRIGYVFSMDIGTDEWLTFENLHFHCETEDGIQWFSDRRHAVVQHNSRSGKWRRFYTDDGLIDDIHALFSSSHGLIWAIGSHEGRAAFSIYDGKTWQRMLHPEFAIWIEPNAFMEAADGTVWLGAGGEQIYSRPAGGALQYAVDEAGSITLLKHHAPPRIPYYVTSMAEAADGTIWLGSISPARYQPTEEEQAQDIDLLGMNSVNMAYDANQTLWLGKEDAGIYRLQDNHWDLFSTPDGLAGERVSDLVMLDDGTMVAATGSGISRFDGHIWTEYAYPEEWTMSSRWCGIHESPNGSLWFNFIDSAEENDPVRKRYYTIRYRPETDAPETEITEYFERVSPAGNSHVSWSAHDPWSRTSRENITYSWQLNHGDWSPFAPDTGNTFLDLASGNHVLEVRSRDRAFNIDPTPARIEFHVIPPIWKQPWFLSLVVGLSSMIVFLITMLIRTREKHLLQQQQDREHHLQELDRMKTGFFTNISHELRTPLTVVSGRLQNLLKGESEPHKKSELSIIDRNIFRLTTLVSQLLDFRKLEEGTLKGNITKGDLSVSLRDWVNSMQVMADDKSITSTLESDEHCRGWFDFDKMEKIFTNLISNAVKYTNNGGHILIRLSKTDPDNSNPQLIFSVEDTGIGIPEKHQKSIFDRFYRVSESSLTSGAGIGLNLTAELVQMLGGEIKFESPIHDRPKEPGSRFTVTLPLTHEKTSDEECQENETPENSPERSASVSDSAPLVLVVEDDEDIRDFIIQGLGTSYRVEHAENGKLGLNIAKKHIPDLIITDLMMPVMDGIELCKNLKTSVETSHIPIIMLTAKASVESQLEGLKTGADDYVTKPFHMDLLEARSTNLLESRRVLREKFLKEYALHPQQLPANSVDDAFLKKALAVLEGQLGEIGFKTDDFAAALNMSPRSLQRKIRAVTDQTPKEFMNEFRMKHAAGRLLNSIDTIAEIAFEIGMDEPSNFTRLFKAHYKMTPTQYRSANKP